MDKNKTTNEDLNKSIDTLIEDLFAEPVQKGENFEVANAAKTTADAAIAAAPAFQDDASRGAGRPNKFLMFLKMTKTVNAMVHTMQL
jgi:hypothetical protein